MRFQLSALTAAALLLRVARADFYIYSDVQYGPSDENGVAGRSSGYTFFNGPPSCDDVGNSIQQYGTDDASGGGVRCSGCGPGDAGADVSNPTLIEWNTKMGHFTWYADRNGDIVGTDGGTAGNCVVDTSDNYDCYFPGALGLPDRGRSQIRCTSSLGADTTNG